jgi:hypothetical protein
MSQNNKICQICSELGHSKFYCKNKSLLINPLLISKGFKPRTGLVMNCLKCGKDVYRHPSRMGKVYCDIHCSNMAKRKAKPSTCVLCRKSFYVNQYQVIYKHRKYCSLSCKVEAMKTLNVGKPLNRKGAINRVQNIVNKHARLRDCGGIDGGTNCISCSVYKPYSELDGGHFIAKTSSAIRFDERNINAQCIKCNRYLSGNGRHYLRGMIAKYGQEITDELESKEKENHKWTIEELMTIENIYKLKIKELL